MFCTVFRVFFSIIWRQMDVALGRPRGERRMELENVGVPWESRVLGERYKERF